MPTRKILIIILLIFISNSNAQEYRKHWADGKLSWSDFKGTPIKNHPSFLSYVLLYEFKTKTINHKMFEGVFADAYINKNLCFVKPNIKDTYHLNYNQVIFNLIEIEKRAFQKSIFNVDHSYEIHALLNDTEQQLQRKILTFQEASDYGIQIDIIEKWLSKTNAELANTQAFEFPNFQKSNWTYGLHGGLDFGIYSNNYKTLFNNTLALNLGFDFSYKNIFVTLDMNFTNSKLKRDLVGNSLFIPQGEKTSIGSLNLLFGYPIYNQEKIKITPFAGYGLAFLSEVGDATNTDEITTGNAVFGLNVDFKNKKRINFTPSLFNPREEGYSYIRARFFISNSNFNPDVKGTVFNIGIAYGFEAHLLSKK